MSQMTLTALPKFPLVEPGDDLLTLISQSLDVAGLSLESGDVLVLAQKIVSKSENRYAYLNEVAVGDEATLLAAEIEKDPRLVQLILSESVEVVRKRPGVVIVEHRNGYVHANAGIDKSNIHSADENPRVLLLPLDPDASARALRESIQNQYQQDVAVIINDSAGRAWRNGTVGMAIGTAGFSPLVNLIGHNDLYQRPLEVTEVAIADELAAAASFIMGQAAEGAPVVLIRGARFERCECGSSSLIRDRSKDLFR